MLKKIHVTFHEGTKYFRVQAHHTDPTKLVIKFQPAELLEDLQMVAASDLGVAGPVSHGSTYNVAVADKIKFTAAFPTLLALLTTPPASQVHDLDAN